MATITIRQLDDGVYERLKERAAENHRSLDAEVRYMLGERTRTTHQIVEDLRASNERRAAEHGHLPDSAALIREMRDDE